MGRKAWLFADSAQGAKASVTCYLLLETAKAKARTNCIERIEAFSMFNKRVSLSNFDYCDST